MITAGALRHGSDNLSVRRPYIAISNGIEWKSANKEKEDWIVFVYSHKRSMAYLSGQSNSGEEWHVL